jgi:hypothetical protein
MELYAAIDLHSNNSVLVVTDAEDHMVFAKRLRNELEMIVSALRNCPLQTLANVRYWAVQFRESLRSTLRSSTTRNRGAPSLCTYLPSALELNMLTSSPPRPSVRGEQVSMYSCVC